MTAILKEKKVVEVPIEDIKLSTQQLRNALDGTELSSLEQSIRENGVLQPLTVRKVQDGYELISGLRRLQASQNASLKSVPCILMEFCEKDSAVFSLLESLQHKDLTFFEEAMAIDRLIKSYGLTQEDTAIKLGKAQSTIANKLRLLKLTDEERAIITEFKLTERHARALLKLPTAQDRLKVIQRVVGEHLNVEKTERAILEYIDENNLKNCGRRKSRRFSDVKTFIKAVSRAVESMQSAGIQANSSKYQCEDYVEYRVRIPLKN